MIASFYSPYKNIFNITPLFLLTKNRSVLNRPEHAIPSSHAHWLIALVAMPTPAKLRHPTSRHYESAPNTLRPTPAKLTPSFDRTAPGRACKAYVIYTFEHAPVRCGPSVLFSI